MIYIRECFACVLFSEFYGVMSLSHFEFIFFYGVRLCPNVTDLHFPVQLSQHYLLKKLFSPLYILTSFVKYSFTLGVQVYCWALYAIPLVHISFFVPILNCFYYCGFVLLSEIWRIKPLAFFSP